LATVRKIETQRDPVGRIEVIVVGLPRVVDREVLIPEAGPERLSPRVIARPVPAADHESPFQFELQASVEFGIPVVGRQEFRIEQEALRPSRPIEARVPLRTGTHRSGQGGGFLIQLEFGAQILQGGGDPQPIDLGVVRDSEIDGERGSAVGVLWTSSL
jgi:hypothetical protein